MNCNVTDEATLVDEGSKVSNTVKNPVDDQIVVEGGVMGITEGVTFSRQELLQEQLNDPEVQQLCQFADEHKIDTVSRGYFMKDGILMWKWRPPTVPASQEWSVIYQVVIPQKYCDTVLNMAHDTPMAGHLGVNKTHCRVLNPFYWPGVSRDVKKFCRSYHTCQVVGKANQKPKVAPLNLFLLLRSHFLM